MNTSYNQLCRQIASGITDQVWYGVYERCNATAVEQIEHTIDNQIGTNVYDRVCVRRLAHMTWNTAFNAQQLWKL